MFDVAFREFHRFSRGPPQQAGDKGARTNKSAEREEQKNQGNRNGETDLTELNRVPCHPGNWFPIGYWRRAIWSRAAADADRPKNADR